MQPPAAEAVAAPDIQAEDQDEVFWKLKSHSFAESLNHAVAGITYAFRHERSLQIHFILALFIMGLCLFLDLNPIELLLIIFAICLVILSEMFNTAVEAMVNMLSLERSPFARRAKDVAAGGVLIACLNAMAVAYLVIYFAIKRPLLEDVFTRIRLHPSNLIPIIIAMILLVVVIGKTLGGRGQFTRGGVISGHAAVAFGVCTAIYCITHNLVITLLGLLLALMVSQSRMEARFHRLVEVLLGALVGVLVALLIFHLFHMLS